MYMYIYIHTHTLYYSPAAPSPPSAPCPEETSSLSRTPGHQRNIQEFDVHFTCFNMYYY